jgi:hypothetical protein
MPVRLSKESFVTAVVLPAAAIIWGLVPDATRHLVASFMPLQLVIT